MPAATADVLCTTILVALAAVFVAKLARKLASGITIARFLLMLPKVPSDLIQGALACNLCSAFWGVAVSASVAVAVGAIPFSAQLCAVVPCAAGLGSWMLSTSTTAPPKSVM